jgi:hypothetical protein
VRSSGAVYRKLKEVRYRHLVALYRKYFRRNPNNCRYNHRYVFKRSDGKPVEIWLCLVHQKNHDSLEGVNPNTIDVCTESDGCSSCDAFVPLLNKERVKELFETELKDKETRQKKYPDICALEWMLERSVVGLPPLSWIQSAYFSIKRVLLKNNIL